MEGSGTVVVDGCGTLAEEVAAQLRHHGLRVHGGAQAVDGAELSLGDDAPPAAVVVVAPGRLPPWAGVPWQARGVAHLPVVVGRRSVVVGPLVLPGRTPCLRCATRATGTARHGEDAEVPPTTLVLATAVTVVTVLSAVRGDASLGAISTELDLHEVRVAHRVWGPRPGCGCARVRMAG